ncbi:hypothetical protein B0T19DRAFT_113304 [Cercophora scortea]|uniref:Uncharacterized protein n=1 Tax=Cercophora scortea TaxID=314031 RepID=A0AAE0IXU1_9PEZI|nr:hypothetical protein B0T19DRAFT_113304 [Cercophora scortea]
MDLAPTTWLNNGPLTTPFTPWFGCDSALPTIQTPLALPSATAAAAEPLVTVLSWPNDCRPDSNYKPATTWVYWSPAVCPSRWSRSLINSVWSAAGALPTLTTRESVAVCCPYGYTAKFPPYTTAAPTPSPWPRVQCQSILDAPYAVSMCYEHGLDESITCGARSTIGPKNINGEPITVVLDTMVVRWNRAQTSMLKITSSPTTTARGTSPTFASVHPPTPTQPPPVDRGIKSTGGIIALSMGLVFGVAILTLTGLMFYRNEKQRRQKAAKPDSDIGLPPYSPPSRRLTGTGDESQDLPPAYHRSETDPIPQPPSYVASDQPPR